MSASKTVRPSWLPAYIPELDGLRGLAVLAVVVYHSKPLLTGTWLLGPAKWGWAGVDLFFVLSGFLITSILLEARKQPHYFRNFYARRLLRIWPVYLLLILFCYCDPPWFLGDTLANQTHWQALVAYALMLQNLRHTPLPGTLGPTWSLAIEEQYYLVWAPLVRFARTGLLTLVLAALLILCPLVRLSHAHWLNPTHTLIHLDGIAWGSLLALGLHHCHWPRRVWAGLGALAAVAGITATFTIAGGTVWLDSAIALAFAGLVLLTIATTGNRAASPLRRGPLPFYGRISYGLYMTHILVFVYFGSFNARLDHMGATGHLMILALRLLASTLVATGLWFGFERPILRLKRHFVL